MLQEKTRGNLSSEEATMLRNTIANLQMAFVEVTREVKGGIAPSTPAGPEMPAPVVPPSEAADAPPPPPAETESRKKFTKSYGA